MSYFTQFSSASPAKITTYTSGSGNFTPISVNQSYARITIVAGGGGGSAAGGGGGGTRIIDWVKLTLSSYPYAVGAGGNGGTANVAATVGSRTIFGPFAVSGGGISPQYPTGGPGGGAMGFLFPTSQNEGATIADIRLGGGAGGRAFSNDTFNPADKAYTVGATAYREGTANYPTANNGLNLGAGTAQFQNNVAVNSFGGGPGGDSYMGIGGAGGANVNNNPGAVGNGYGAGGGGGSSGAAGTGGIIIIEEFVQ